MTGAEQSYIRQLLKTATKGNVTVEYALHVDRMKLMCSVCDSQLTTAEPEGTNLDYGIQEFIKIHAHVGGHKDKPIYDPEATATPVTLDFKKVTSKGMIDEKYAMAQKIESQMQAYEKELAEKMSDVALANKIKILQMGDGPKAEAMAKLAQKAMLQKVNSGDVEQSKAELIALQNIVLIQQMKAQKQQLLGQISGQHAQPIPKKAKLLKIATGRKFR